MYNIIIFGTGKTCELVMSGLESDVNILCYLDNNSNKWNQKFYESTIRNPIEISKFSYDFIIIASEFNDPIYEQLLGLKVEKEKILQFFNYYGNCFNYIKRKIDYLFLKENQNNIELLITGISYIDRAINGFKICKKSINLANPSQDIYYDYELIKYILENGKFRNLKYIIIGLCYYSFQYDMSKSSKKKKVSLYYEVVKKRHNFEEFDKMQEEININNEIGEKIFIKDYYNASIVSNELNIVINDENGQCQAKLDCNKNYPDTVIENKEILERYIKLLNNYNIKPIIVIAPVSKYYSKYFSKNIKNEFLNIIDELESKYEFQCMDYFDSDLFEISDFYDVSHLNEAGALKFTNLLNKKINW